MNCIAHSKIIDFCRKENGDDDLTDFVGAVLMDIDTSEGESKEGKHGDCNETMFLLVKTSKGVINCCTHNEHNGYYGGFHMVLEAGEAQ